MSATPRQRAEAAVRTLPALGTSDAVLVDVVLSAALDAEELARQFYRLGTWCGDCDHDGHGWTSCSACRQACRDYAVAVRDWTLRGAAS